VVTNGERSVKDELEMTWKKENVAYSPYFPENLRKATINYSHSGWSSVWIKGNVILHFMKILVVVLKILGRKHMQNCYNPPFPQIWEHAALIFVEIRLQIAELDYFQSLFKFEVR
jgi:hypothetical protein